MIPLTDRNPTRSFPIITVALILINCYVYFLQVSGGPGREAAITATYAMVPEKISTGDNSEGILENAGSPNQTFVPCDPTQVSIGQNDIPVLPAPTPVWLTIFTSMFMHANLLHIGGNMLFLWIFGNNVEDALGKIRYLFFYLFCGVVAALVQTFADPHSYIPTLGASGAIAGVLGAYIVMWPQARVLTLFIIGLIFLREISAFWVLGIWILEQIWEAWQGLGGLSTGGVAVFAHVGGFFTGMLITFLLGGRALGNRQRQVAQPQYQPPPRPPSYW